MIRSLFLGTPEFAVPSLAVTARLTDLVAVVAQPDRPRGRGQIVLAPPTVDWARQNGIPVFQPEKFKAPETLASLEAFQAELIVVVAFGRILPRELLEVPRLGCLNVHASLLPRHRGAAPIQWAIARGDAETGVTLMKMDEGLDTGPILLQRTCAIFPKDTGESLSLRLAALGAETLAEGLPLLFSGQLKAQPQDPSRATLAPKLSREDGRIDFRASAVEIERRLRAFHPWPGASCTLPGGKHLKLLNADVVPGAGPPGQVVALSAAGLVVATGVEALRIFEVQPESGRRMKVAEFLAGHPLSVGAVLG
jgi:methionyl-tRNA formyltransferase